MISVSFVSDYFQQLEPDVQVRYMEKIKVVENKDPYLQNIKECSVKVCDFPKISYFDILNYLKYARNPYSDEDLKAIKSSEAYTRFACGWVRQLGIKRYDKHTLVMGRVLHSQRLNEPPLKPWVICEIDGKIICAHCNCVAGNGEACSHVGGLLFAIEAAVWHEPQSVTGVKAYWVPPSKKVGAQNKIINLDFTSGKRKFEALNVNEEVEESEEEFEFVPEPTEERKKNFLLKLSRMSHSSAILDVVAPYCFEERQKVKDIEDQFLTALYDEDLASESLDNLIKYGRTIDFTMSQEECDYIEGQTRSQAKLHLWFGHRSGRITASLFKRVCRTKIEKPSSTLIKQICYPSKHKFRTEATTYGCTHEKVALKEYTVKMKSTHIDFEIEQVGLMINPKYPYFGALIYCSCHGKGCVEVKCPFCVKDVDVTDLTKLKNSCLQSINNAIGLDKNHAYYYQVQMQMAVSQRSYGDFVVWNKNSMFTQRITFQKEFWDKQSSIASKFFNRVILPELTAKYFTSRIEEQQQQPPSTTTVPVPTSTSAEEPQPSGSSAAESLWCFCKSSDDNTPMVACDNPHCTIIWYHFKCLNIKAVPEGTWFCPTCTNLL